MPTKEEGTGLLSKVVKFVKNPTTTWGGIDAPDSDRESSYSKQILKEMIERKRRNDFVRKREFDMLRKMRRSEIMAGQDPGARPSFFQSSMPSKPDDRATTLKKIDEIEAQMSMQWWKTKHGETAAGRLGETTSVPLVQSTSGTGLEQSPSLVERPFIKTRPQSFEAMQAPTQPADLEHVQLALAPMSPMQASAAPVAEVVQAVPPVEPVAQGASVQPAAVSNAAPATAPRAPVPPVNAPPPFFRAGPPTEPGGFSMSKQFAIDVEEFAHDPELEEAAIRFANGDDAGAEAGLLEVLRPGGSRIDHDETWLALFDLYRAIGQQERFEPAAIDFAGRFGRSAPQWVSLPEAVGRMNAPAPAAAAGATQLIANWTSPANLGSQSIAAMNAALGKAQAPWKLSWVKLNAIDEAALEPLTRQFTQWASRAVQLRFIGADNLEQVLRNATPSGDQRVNPSWWKLRMEVLRVMHRPDEFELVALDYCVTYEVSPPSWESSRCEYKPLQADGSAIAGHSVIQSFGDSMSSNLSAGYSDTAAAGLSSQMMNMVSVELAGQVLGDATEAMEVLEAKTLGADVMNITCSRLIRIDFTAAGGLLNWVSARQSEGRQVQFDQVHRLVAAFFNVIGISEHARVVARTD